MLFQINMFPTQMLIIFLFIFQYDFALGCKPNGSIFCSADCSELFKCVNEVSILLQKCSYGYLCNYITKDCISNVNPADPGTCKKLGGFSDSQCGTNGKPLPDLTDCTTYTECNETKTLKKCPDWKSFNPLTRLCDQDLDSDVCKNGLTPKCTKTNFGESGPVDANPQFYWICTNVANYYHMKLFQCDDGSIFKKELQDCISDEPATTLEPPAGGNNHTCTGNEYYPDLDDCQCFYSCSGNNKPSERFCCQENYFYNTVKGMCQPGTCDNL